MDSGVSLVSMPYSKILCSNDLTNKEYEEEKVPTMPQETTFSHTESHSSTDAVILPYEVTDEYYIEQLPQLKKKYLYNFIKRMADIILAFLGLVITAVPMLVIAVMIKIKMGGTVFYRQTRLGLNGKPFQILKFRTMAMDAEVGGAQWSEGSHDSRITALGAALRQYRLDELPQFFNVLSGTMSLVGPRPERPCFYDAFETYIHGFSQRLAVKPGITGLAQVNGGYGLRPEEKILHDVEYIKKRSLWLDFIILLKTVEIVLHHRDAK